MENKEIEITIDYAIENNLLLDLNEKLMRMQITIENITYFIKIDKLQLCLLKGFESLGIYELVRV